MSEQKNKLQKALEILSGIQAELKIKLSQEPPAGGDPAEQMLTGKDGKQYKVIGALEAGSEIFEVGTEGEVKPSDGDIELESGQLITVLDGKIQEVKESPIPADPVEQFRAQFAAQAQEIQAQKNQISDLQKAIADLLNVRKEENEAILKGQDAVFQAIKEIAEAPNGGDPAGTHRTFPKTKKGGPLSRMG